MIFLMSQMRDRITDLELQKKGDCEEARSLRFLMLETLSRLALALAIDEVMRPENYYEFLDDDQKKSCERRIKGFFAFREDNRVRGTLGDYLSMAETLLKEFDTKKCPESIKYILDLIGKTKDLAFIRNIEGHERAVYIPRQISKRINEICDGISTLKNPYLSDEKTALLNIYPDFYTNASSELECQAVVRSNHKPLSIAKRALLRLAEGSDERLIERTAQEDIMARIALNKCALYLRITLPSGATRLHLLSPLIVFLPEESQFAIYHRRQNTWFQASVYIRVTGSSVTAQELTWDEDMLVCVGREERLKSIGWDSDLFVHETTKKSPTYSEVLEISTDKTPLKCNINVHRASKEGIYPGFWDALFKEERYFNVPIYDRETLEKLNRMFEAKQPPLSNPLYICGVGGVGKTYTVLHTLRQKFVRNPVLPLESMRFKYVIFLTAKKIIYNTDKMEAISKSDYSDFRTTDEALKKILTVLRDQEPQESKTKALIKAVRNYAMDPMLIIIDDLDSVVAPIEYDDREKQRMEDYNEQRKLAEALDEIVRDNDNCRVIVTTRRPLDEVRSLRLFSMTDEQSIRFAKSYYDWSMTGQMPNQYKVMVTDLGEGIPAYVMRIVYLLNHDTKFEFTESKKQQFKEDVANFSLSTTKLSETGIWLFKGIEKLSNVLDAIPNFLLQIVFFDVENMKIEDAERGELQSWDIIELRDNGMLALRDDSQLLWDQLDDEKLLTKHHTVLLTEHHTALLNALLREGELLKDFGTKRVGDLLLSLLECANKKLSTEQKQSFARRMREIISDPKSTISQNLRSAPEQRDEICQCLDEWDRPASSSSHWRAKVDTALLPKNAPVADWIARLERENWTIDTMRQFLESFSDEPRLNQKMCMLWEQAAEFLPEHMKKVLFQEEICDEEMAQMEKLGMLVDSINTRYKEMTGRDLSESYAFFLS